MIACAPNGHNSMPEKPRAALRRERLLIAKGNIINNLLEGVFVRQGLTGQNQAFR